MTRQRKRQITHGEKTRKIKARKDCILKKVEQLQNLTELGACVIIPMPDGNFETWPKDRDKLREVFNLYEENLIRSQNENTNQAERSCCVADRLSRESFVGQSCHESSAAGLEEEGVEKERNRFLASDFGNHEPVANGEISGKELLPLEENWCDQMSSLPYPGTEACNWFNESYNNNMMADTNTTFDDHTMFQPLQICYPETNFGSLYDMPQPVPLQVSYPASLPSFESTHEFLGSIRMFQPYIQEEGEILREALGSTTHHEDVNTSGVGSWGTMPQVFTQFHADHMGGSMHNGNRGTTRRRIAGVLNLV